MNNTETFTCPAAECDKTFKTERGLAQHMRASEHTAPELVVCDHCGAILSVAVVTDEGTFGRWCAGTMDGTRAIKSDRLKNLETDALIGQYELAAASSRTGAKRLALITELLTERAAREGDESDELAAEWLSIDD